MDIETQLERGKETIALRVSNDCNESSNYGHIHIDVVYQKNNTSKYGDSIGFYANYYNDKHQYKGLTISCQMDAENELPYGYDLRIDERGTRGITLSNAEAIVKALRPIKRKMAKITDVEGYVTTYEEFVLRVVRVLGAKAFYAKYENNAQYQRSDHMGSLRDYLRSLIRDNQAMLGFQKAA